MHIRRLRLLLPIAACAALLSACEGGEGITTPPPSPPIATGTWFLHTVDANPLPAKISERFIGIIFEEVFLDSARVTFDAASGIWGQRYWTRTLHQQVEDRRDVIIDQGSSAATGGVYTFTSSVRARTLEMRSNTATQVTSTELMVFHVGAEPVTGIYRSTPP